MPDIVGENLSLKEHLLLKVDARIKVSASLAILSMLLSYKGFAFSYLVLLLSLFFCLSMKIPIKVFALRFLEPLFIAFMVVILKGLYKDGLMEGLIIASRILAAVSIIAVLGFSTPFTEFISALSWMRVPKGFIEILMFAYRYIFMLLEDALVIYSAQKNRLGYAKVSRSLNSFGVLSGSLVLKAFEQGHNITIAMLQRGYDGNLPRLRQKPFKRYEIIFALLFIVTLGVIWKL